MIPAKDSGSVLQKRVACSSFELLAQDLPFKNVVAIFTISHSDCRRAIQQLRPSASAELEMKLGGAKKTGNEKSRLWTKRRRHESISYSIYNNII